MEWQVSRRKGSEIRLQGIVGWRRGSISESGRKTYDGAAKGYQGAPDAKTSGNGFRAELSSGAVGQLTFDGGDFSRGSASEKTKRDPSLAQDDRLEKQHSPEWLCHCAWEFNLNPRSQRGRRTARQFVFCLGDRVRNKRPGRRRGFPYLSGRARPFHLARPGGGIARRRRGG